VSVFTLDELRAVFLARDFRDGEVGAVGLAAPIPMAAMRLAQETHAPNLTIASEAGVNPRPAVLVQVPIDPRGSSGIEYVSDLYDMFIKAEHGIDFWFMSGVQTDQFGNINLHYIGGSRERPRFRGPGVGNVSYASMADRWYSYPSAHSLRTFVEKVDFVTALGNAGGVAARRATAPRYGGGCRFVISNLGVMDFDEQTGRMRLRHVHPGVSVRQVVDATGFDLLFGQEVTETPPPTDEELRILREVVDPSGVLRRGLTP
jgi:glutaconate CoA-transferase subunit B